MIDDKTWMKFVGDFDTYKRKKKARVTCVDGDVFEDICDGTYEEEDSNGVNGWAISVGPWILTQEMVEKIEFID